MKLLDLIISLNYALVQALMERRESQHLPQRLRLGLIGKSSVLGARISLDALLRTAAGFFEQLLLLPSSRQSVLNLRLQGPLISFLIIASTRFAYLDISHRGYRLAFS